MATGPSDPDRHENTPSRPLPEGLSAEDVLALVIGRRLVAAMRRRTGGVSPVDNLSPALRFLPLCDEDHPVWDELGGCVVSRRTAELKQQRDAEESRQRQMTIEVIDDERLNLTSRAPETPETERSLLERFAEQLQEAGVTLWDHEDVAMLQSPQSDWSSCDHLRRSQLDWPSRVPVTPQDIMLAFEAAKMPCNFPAALQYLAENIDSLTPGVYLSFRSSWGYCFVLIVDGEGDARRLRGKFSDTHLSVESITEHLKAATPLLIYVITAEPPPATS